MIETQQRQQTRPLQTVLTALQSSETDGSFELPERVDLPAKSLQELMNIEKQVQNAENFHKVVCTRSFNVYIV